MGTDCSGAEVWVFAPGFFATGEPSENGDKRNFVPEKKTMEPENVGFGRCFCFLTFSVSVRPLFSKAPWFALKAIIGELVGALDLEGFHISKWVLPLGMIQGIPVLLCN